jgi:predicted dehydrogenase
VIDCLRAGKSVFVEKPLCLRPEELDAVVTAYEEAVARASQSPLLAVGFNRRFAPLTALIKERVEARKAPLSLTFTCNAGALPSGHWAQIPEIGGGRIVGEACHFIDLLSYLCGARVSRIAAVDQGPLGDNAIFLLGFEDGSVGHINYFTRGSKSYPKERLDVFFEGKTLSLENFRKLTGYGIRGLSRKKLWKQDKGHEAGFLAFLDAVKSGKESPTPFNSVVETTRATFAAVESMRSGEMVEV